MENTTAKASGIKSTLKKDVGPVKVVKKGVTFNNFIEESQDSEWEKSESSSKKLKKSPIKGFDSLPADIKAMISPLDSDSDYDNSEEESESESSAQ